jgi:rRNA-processing protein FCF1
MLLVDAANVVGSRPDGWWRDRPAAASRLVEQLRAAAAASRLSVPAIVVIEGAARRGVPEGVADGVEVVHAAGEGDDTLVALAAEADEPVVVVSADRGLRRRVARDGVTTLGPGWLLDQITT